MFWLQDSSRCSRQELFRLSGLLFSAPFFFFFFFNRRTRFSSGHQQVSVCLNLSHQVSYYRPAMSGVSVSPPGGPAPPPLGACSQSPAPASRSSPRAWGLPLDRDSASRRRRQRHTQRASSSSSSSWPRRRHARAPLSSALARLRADAHHHHHHHHQAVREVRATSARRVQQQPRGPTRTHAALLPPRHGGVVAAAGKDARAVEPAAPEP